MALFISRPPAKILFCVENKRGEISLLISLVIFSFIVMDIRIISILFKNPLLPFYLPNALNTEEFIHFSRFSD